MVVGAEATHLSARLETKPFINRQRGQIGARNVQSSGAILTNPSCSQGAIRQGGAESLPLMFGINGEDFKPGEVRLGFKSAESDNP